MRWANDSYGNERSNEMSYGGETLEVITPMFPPPHMAGAATAIAEAAS